MDCGKATQGTPKGEYDKTNHAPALLNQLNPAAVYTACPNFASLVDFLRGNVGIGH